MMWISSLLVVVFVASSALASAEQGRTRFDKRTLTRTHGQSDHKMVSKRGNGHGDIHGKVTHPGFPSHSIRLKQAKLCDDKAKMHSGFLGIGHHKQLFFVFAESRSATPSQDPLILWLQGGPGCTSSTGLLMEVGPCRVVNGGKSTIKNQYSWTEKANIIFLDSPVMTGFSRGLKSLDNSHDVAEDVYAFMQLFYQQFPKLAKNDFHLSGESYAGKYIPNVASIMHHNNKLLHPAHSNGLIHIPLVSMTIGNGVTDAYTQYGSYYPFLCGGEGRKPILDEGWCEGIKPVIKQCQNEISRCYKTSLAEVCSKAERTCDRLDSPIGQMKLNYYDVTKTCDPDPSKDGPSCYKELMWLVKYLNQPEIQAELGVNPRIKFEMCSDAVYDAFMKYGDITRNTATLIPELLEAGLRMLIYAGENDSLCNYIGNLEWTLALPWSGHAKYNQAQLHEFKLPNGHAAGKTKSFGSLTYLQVYGAGHLVPHDKPAEALEMITRWLHRAAL